MTALRKTVGHRRHVVELRLRRARALDLIVLACIAIGVAVIASGVATYAWVNP